MICQITLTVDQVSGQYIKGRTNKKIAGSFANGIINLILNDAMMSAGHMTRAAGIRANILDTANCMATVMRSICINRSLSDLIMVVARRLLSMNSLSAKVRFSD